MTAPECLFILNPAAGNGRSSKIWERNREALLGALDHASFIRTEGPGHAAILAREALLQGVKKIVVIGGDGTISEMVEGAMQVPETLRRTASLSCLPAGSGCDTTRHLGYPEDFEGLVRLLTQGRCRRVDVGRIHYTGLDGSARVRHFINLAAFCLAGDVAHHIHQMGKSLGGTLSYLVSTLYVLSTARAKYLRLSADDTGLDGRYHLCVLANTSTTGGGMRIAPQAVENDGFFDLVTIPDMSRLRLLLNFPRIYSGTHLDVPGIAHRRVRRLKADCEETAYLNIDGEADGRLPASFEIVPQAVTWLVPGNPAGKEKSPLP